MEKHNAIDLLRFKADTLTRYNGMYIDFLREAVVSNEGLADFDLYSVAGAIDTYAKAYNINGGGLICDDNPKDNPIKIRPETVFRCARLMKCVYDKSPAKPSKQASFNGLCTISSYGLKHVLEYWLGRLSDHTVSKPDESSLDSYVSNGEAIMACFVLRDQFEGDGWYPAVRFRTDNLKGPHMHPNLGNIRFNKKFKNFLHRGMDAFGKQMFEFRNDADGNPIVFPKFNDKHFRSPVYQPCYIWGARL